MITIGELLDKLEDYKDKEGYKVGFEFAMCKPTYFDSYRGSYDEIALAFSGEYGVKYPTAQEFYLSLSDTLEESYSGWKGGEYYMTRDTPIHINCGGVCSKTVLKDISVRHFSEGENGWITLLTEEIM